MATFAAAQAAVPLAAGDKLGAGGIAFVIVLLLMAASAGIFFAMRGSLSRLRRSVDDGSFGSEATRPKARPGRIDHEQLEEEDEDSSPAATRPANRNRGGAGA